MPEPIQPDDPRLQAAIDQVLASIDAFGEQMGGLDQAFEAHADALVSLHRAVLGEPEPPKGGIIDESGLDVAGFTGVFCDLLEAVLRADDDDEKESARMVARQRMDDLKADDSAQRIMWQLIAMTITRAWVEETGQSVAAVVARVRKPG